MSKEVTYNEIGIYVEISGTITTKRLGHLIYNVPSLRIVNLNYKKPYYDKRHAYFQTNPIVNERRAVTGESVYNVIEIREQKGFIPYFRTPTGEFFVKVDLEPNEKLTVYIDTSEPNPPDDTVPTIFDDFTSGTIDSSKWAETADNIEFGNSSIICSGGDTNLTTTQFEALDEYVVKYRAIQYDSDSRWGCLYRDERVDNDNSITNFYEGSNPQWTNFFSTGSADGLANLRVDLWHDVEIHYSKSENVGRFYFNGELKVERYVPPDKGIATYFKFYSCRKIEYDYILIYRKNPKDVEIQVQKLSNDKYQVVIWNRGDNHISQEIKVDGIDIQASELAVYVQSVRYIYLDYKTEQSSTIGFTPAGLPGSNERFAFLVPNAQTIISTTQIILPVTYWDGRYALIGSSITSQRFAIITIQEQTSRNAFIQTYKEAKLSSPITLLTIKAVDDKWCYVEILDKYSQRSGYYIASDNSSRYAIYQIYQQGILTSPLVNMSISGVITERYVHCHSISPVSERLCYLQRNPDSIRFATFNYGIGVERLATYYTDKYVLLHDTKLCQCIPYKTERFGFTQGYQYYTELNAICKQGDRYIVKKPTLSGKFQVISYKQDKTQFKLYSDNKVEVYSDAIGLSQYSDNPVLYELAGTSDKPNIVIRAVETIGGSALSDKVEKKEKVLCYGKFIASVFIQESSDRFATFTTE